MHFIPSFFFLMFACSLAAQTAVQLDESALVEAIRKGSAEHARLDAANARSDLLEAQADEIYTTMFQSNVSYMDTSKPNLVAYQPQFGPVVATEFALEKVLGAGTSGKIGVFTEQYSTTNGQISKQTYAGLRAQLSIDLWKNLLGRFHESQTETAHYTKKQQTLKSKVEKYVYEIQARKLYWSLVATREKRKAASSLLESAKKQLSESKRRLSAGLGTKSEVYKNEAQVSNRLALITALDYQNETMIIQLKKMTPELQGKEVVFRPVDLTAKVRDVIQCTSIIATKEAVPWEYTLYDEILELTERKYQAIEKIDRSYADADVKLVGSYEHVGLGKNYDGGREALSENPGREFTTMLTLSIPIGGQKSAAEKIKYIETNANRAAEIYQMRSLVRSKHQHMKPLIDLLKEAVKNRRETGESFKRSVDETSQLYRQARVSLDALINDQNMLLSSTIDEIDAKLLVVHELLDYFAIFMETPCSMNQI